MEEREDRFAHLIKFCKPTTSQEEKFLLCPLAGQSKNFLESNRDLSSSSSELTPIEATGIEMVSPPESAVDRNSQREEEPLFHTPPEEQNPDEYSSDGARYGDLCDGFEEREKIRNTEGETDDVLISEKIRVEEGLQGETMPIDETEKITDEIDENKGVEHYVDLTGLVSVEFGEEFGVAVNFGADSREKVHQRNFREGKGVGEAEEVAGKLLDAGNENDELMKRGVDMGNAVPNECVNLYQNVNSSMTSGRRKVTGNGGVRTSDNWRVGGDKEFANLTADETVCKDICEEGHQRRGVKNIEEIDRFKYVGGSEFRSGKNGRDGGGIGVTGKRRELPLSMKGRAKDVGVSRDVVVDPEHKKNQLLKDFLNAFNVVVGDAKDGCEDMDFLGIAKKRGLTFPRPRWWPPEDDDQ